MATHSSIFAWEIPRESLVGYSLWGCKRVRLDLAIIQQQYTNVHCELPKEGSKYGLSHIYLTMESGFFFFFKGIHSHEQCFPGHISGNSSDEGAEMSRSSHLPPDGPF